MIMELEKKKQIFYRGYIKSCNYSCEYCPFSKHISQKELKRDAAELERFVSFMEKNPLNAGAVMITPYGEALIHEHYWGGLAALSNTCGIEAVGCQTNLSFPVKRMLEVFERAGGGKEKLRLWCTFHPAMVSKERFLEQCRLLEEEKISYCIGSVGVPENIELLKQMRNSVSEKVYLWINPMDGLGRSYTQEEIKCFTEIDPFFPYLLKHKKAKPQNCRGCKGESLFISWNGDITPCNISKKKLGNIYEMLNSSEQAENRDRKTTEIINCGRLECSCFLSYCNRLDYPELLFYGKYPAFRIPNIPQAIFLDVDGTIVKKGQDSVEPELIKEIEHWSQYAKIYLATSLPYVHAMKKCSDIKKFLAGGVFANGGMVCLFEEKNQQIMPMEQKAVVFIRNILGTFSIKVREYQHKGQLYKITGIGKQAFNAYEALLKSATEQGIEEYFSIILEEDYLQITAKEANKLSGVLSICKYYGYRKDRVFAIGDSENDKAMMEYFPN